MNELHELREKIRQWMIQYLEDQINMIIVKYNNEGTNELEALYRRVSDFLWLVNLGGISGICQQSAIDHFTKLFESTEYRDSRAEFILRAQAYLKFKLGAEAWNDLLDDLKYALMTSSSNEKLNERHAVVDPINRKLTTPSTEMLSANPWMVPVILYSLFPEIAEVIQTSLDNIRRMIIENNKRKRPQ